MAEMAPIPFVDNLLTVDTVHHDSRPHLELVEPANERPPKLTPEEAEHLLERGSYVAKLRADKRILSTVLAFADDEQTAGLIGDQYLDVLRQDVRTSTRALRAFDRRRRIQEAAAAATIEVVPDSPVTLGEHAVKVAAAEAAETEEPLPQMEQSNTVRLLQQARRMLIARSRPDPFRIDVRSGGTKISKDGETITADNWNQFSACLADHPDAMFVRGAEQNKAKALCASCDVRRECLAEALDNQIEWGVWGGMTERERRALLRKNNWRRIFEAAEKPR